MSTKKDKKEQASKIREELLEELGEEEFNRIFEETKRTLRLEYGVLPRLSWEDVVLTMDYRLRKPAGKKYERLEDFEDVTVSHDGKHWKVYYYSVDLFREDLPIFGKFLDLLQESGEEVSAIIPNIGWVKTAMLFGPPSGVKGFAVIARKPKTLGG